MPSFCQKTVTSGTPASTSRRACRTAWPCGLPAVAVAQPGAPRDRGRMPRAPRRLVSRSTGTGVVAVAAPTARRATRVGRAWRPRRCRSSRPPVLEPAGADVRRQAEVAHVVVGRGSGRRRSSAGSSAGPSQPAPWPWLCSTNRGAPSGTVGRIWHERRQRRPLVAPVQPRQHGAVVRPVLGRGRRRPGGSAGRSEGRAWPSCG